MRDGSFEKPSLSSSFVCAIALSMMFLLVYGGCLAITSFRHDVRTLYFPWELRIPLVRTMIVPYWSLDLFFVSSFFLVGTNRELRTLSFRLAAAQVVAGIFFLLFPLQTAYPHPQIGGIFGAMFDVLHGFDLRYNCAPSLHIAIAIILWAVYVPKVRYGPLRMLVALWFVLIMASTLLTWQHHVADVVSGAALGIACLAMPLPRRGQSLLAPPRMPRTISNASGAAREYALPRRGRCKRVMTAARYRSDISRQHAPPRHARAVRWDRH